MRKFLLLSVLLLIATNAAQAATLVNISNLADFQFNGVSGTAGNGRVALSPKYTFGFGDEVDFGTAFLFPDPPDGRAGPCTGLPGSNCMGGWKFSVYYLVDGMGGLSAAPFELPFFPNFIFCSPNGCPAVQLRLSYDLPDNVNGIQFAFQGERLTIAPPVPELSTWAMMILGFAGVGYMAYRRKRQTTALA